MQISIAIGALTGYPLRTAFGFARDAEADGVEIMLTPAMVRDNPRHVQDLAERSGLPILSAHAVLSYLPRSDDWRMRHDLASIQFAGRLPGCEVLVLHPPLTGPQLSPGLIRWLEMICRERDAVNPELKLAIENRSQNYDGIEPQLLDDLERLREVTGEWGAHVTLDLAHAASHGGDVRDSVRQVFPRLANVHLSDARARRLRNGIVTGLFRDHQFPGEGVLPLAAALDILRNSGYKGLVTLELSPMSLRAFWPPAARRRLQQSVHVVREMLADPAGATGNAQLLGSRMSRERE